ncbi:hypothetical protein [Microbacterium sp. 2FI]|uniref:hypothetical protein n=1 Tax=Microbacterium sp. 2FI TaxID=2502193 RepID=UPI0010FA45ED|nr:hypothetical protein [Microbacterium sp. 2FI]
MREMETKPTSFARGVPPEERNGLYGIEDDLMEAGGGEPVVAVVVYAVDEVVHKEIAGERYPVVKVVHIEPLRDEKSVAAALRLRDAAYKARTGENALDLPEVDD